MDYLGDYAFLETLAEWSRDEKELYMGTQCTASQHRIKDINFLI